MMTDTMQQQGDDLTRLVQWFESAEEVSREAREAAERDRDYYDNQQLTPAEIATLKARGQPVIIINRIKRKIDFLRGVEAQQRTDPKAFPRNPQDEQSAHAATDALRFVAESNDFDAIRSEVWENLLIEGMGGCEIIVEQRAPVGGLMGSTALSQPTYEIVINHIPWDRLFVDPASRKPDCSDARYLGQVIWLDFDTAMAMWPDAKDALTEIRSSQVTAGETYDDRPRHTMWTDNQRKRVRVVQMWHKEGKGWSYCTFTKGAKLEGGPSPYQGENGQPECPIILQSAYIDRKNQRYGVVREMIGPQDEINKRRSKALHLLNSRQTFANDAAIQDVDALKRELAKPDGHVKIDAGEFGKDFGVIPTGDMTSGHFQLLQEAKAEIDMMGPNAAMQGKSSAEQSGRAIIAQQQGGYIELGPMMDRLRNWNIRCYRAMWNRIRQFWTEERWIRVTDDERNVRFVGLNTPMQGPDGQTVVYSPAQMMVDIVVDDAPDSVTIQHEQYQQLVELTKAGIPIPPDVLIEASQLRNKDRLLEMLRPQQPDPAAMELQARGAEAEVRSVEAKAMRDEAQAHKLMAEVQGAGLPSAPVAPSPLDEAERIAKIEQTQAQTRKLDAEALARTVEMSRPEPVIPPQQQ